jgi:hypothetical protein
VGRALTAQRTLAGLAAAFGVVTIAAGTRVLLGTDPGYVVYRPLLLFNTAMGFAYLIAAVVVWRDLLRGRNAALAIFALNLAALAWIAWLHRSGASVATTSLGAMTLRVGFWLALAVAVGWLARRGRTAVRDGRHCS